MASLLIDLLKGREYLFVAPSGFQTTGHMAVGADASIDSLVVVNIAEELSLSSGGSEAPALKFVIDITGSGSALQPLGLLAQVNTYPTGFVPQLIAVAVKGVINQVGAKNWNTSAISAALKGVVASDAASTGGMNNVAAVLAASPELAGSTPVSLSGFYANNQGYSGITNAYGVYVAPQSGATNNYGGYFGSKVGFNTTAPTSWVDVNSDTIRVRTSKTPASATDTGNQGEIAWDSNYIYICTATNTWKRAAIATW